MIENFIKSLDVTTLMWVFLGAIILAIVAYVWQDIET
jgi:hypothetical protein